MNKQRLINLIKLERKRELLAKKGKIQLLRGTYEKSDIKDNKNTGKFWDEKFNKTPTTQNWVEQDRNRTSWLWLSKILKPNMSVLNIGCGDGKFEKIFLSTLNNVNYEGMDFAKKSISVLRKEYPSHRFSVGNVIKTKLRRKYDVICVFEVLEHIRDYQVLQVLRSIESSLNTNGFIMVAVPLNEPLLEMFPDNPNEHVRIYSKDVIVAELEMSGFSIVRIEEFVAFSSFYSIKNILWKYLLKNKWKPNDILVLAQKK